MPTTKSRRYPNASNSRPRNGGNRQGPAKPAYPKNNRRRAFGGKGPLLILLAAVLGIGLFAGISWARSYYTDTIIEGVLVEGVDVGGMTREEARLAVEQVLSQVTMQAEVHVTSGDKQWVLTGDQLRIETDLADVLDQVLSLGRTGNLSERRAQTRQYRDVPENFDVAITYDQQVIDELFNQIGSEVNIDPQQSVITFDPMAEDPEMMFSFTEGRWGQRVAMDAMKAQLMEDFMDDYIGHVELSVEPVPPEVTREAFEKSTQQIAYFGTDMSGSLNTPRTQNIQLAMSTINGMILMPGESFSFNETVGERTKARGYQEAPVIARDKGLEDALGGGICQASTTIYNAALLAGCTIDQRSRHSFPSSYVKLGFDAMVNWPNHDLVFTNVTAGPLYIKAVVERDNQGVHTRVWIYGTPNPDGITYDRKYVVVEREPAPEPVIRPDKEGKYIEFVTYDDEQHIYSISREGIRVQTYRLWIKDGEVIKEEELYLDYYKPIAGIIYTGTTPASERPPAETPAPPSEDDGTTDGDETPTP